MDNKPKHVGIILDGNRRFSKKIMLEPWKGHEYGAKKLEQLFKWCKEVDIKELTLYCFSMQNFNRPKIEFDYLMKLFDKALTEALDNEDIHNNKIQINVIGRIELFSEELQSKIKALVDATKDYSDYKVNFALAYGGREEIVDAVKKLGREIEDGKVKASSIDEKYFEKFLYTASEPDMIIRTGGDHRTSNFLAWQGVYSEWFFLEKTWPEFEKEDLVNCITDFVNRERRFGK